MLHVEHLDHLVLTVASIEASLDFYTHVLGMTAVSFGYGRHALVFGNMRIHLHKAGQELEPAARFPKSGSADLCFLTASSMDDVLAHLLVCRVEPELGPVQRQGAAGDLESVYIRDPDDNLIEIARART